VPYRIVAYCPSLVPSGDHPPFVAKRHDRPAWMNRRLWWAMALLSNAHMRRAINAERRKIGLAPLRDVLTTLLGDAPLLAADEELAPAPTDSTLPIRQIGCLHPFDEAPLPPKLEAFLEQGEPPVYIGFGSMTDPNPRITTRAVLAGVTDAGCRAVLSEGWAGLGGGGLPEHVMVVGSVPHASLFRRVAAVVHHGGAGTTTMAARAGVPQIVVPHVLDQYYWAERVSRLGVGTPPIHRAELTRERLAESLRALRDNELVSERASALGERLRERIATREDPACAVVEFDRDLVMRRNRAR
jgi:UDP:flavonoid glycosyltransferase YjiC (YdhE family)